MTSRRLTDALCAVALAAACASEPAAPAPSARIVSLVPAGGATGVDRVAPIVITFSHPMPAGIERYVVLHEGGLDGAVVPMTCTWSPDATALTCAHEPLVAATRYALHIGGGIRDRVGAPLDYEGCIGLHGGQWATGGMMGIGDRARMGPGWRHANGTYGMVFTFTTA
jgi:hypothetical protein